MSKITIQGYILIPDKYLALVQVELPKHVELTNKEEGCLVFHVSQSEEDKNTFNVYEEFIDRDAFEAHQERVKSSRWGEITANVERHYQIGDGG